MRTILVTGAAGFIGYHLSKRFLGSAWQVVGLDNLNDYYSVQLKRDRLAQLCADTNFTFLEGNIADRTYVQRVFGEHRFDRVVHLAAQAGVRYSLTHPEAYVDSNLVGFLTILEGCRHQQVEHLVFASSSSVYGSNKQQPFSVLHNVDHPVSLYAATKKANELMAHTYSHLYALPTTGLRFFTVYGPWGRPDMALFHFTKSILNGQPIDVYNYGQMKRDFTYINDIVDAIVRLVDVVPAANPNFDPLNPDPSSSQCPYRILNIGNHQPVSLLDFISAIEQATGKKAIQNLLPLQPGDVEETFADVSELQRIIGFRPSTSIEIGIEKFVAWYREYHLST